jgi:murein DD-endopeptidase MepM/ murein hydrolase activator NlpD
MTFPLRPAAAYSYRDDFLLPRLGVVYAYNHARGRAANGTLLRAHDGIDISVALRTPVIAAVSGTIVDPAKRWKPWDPARYGNILVIASDEPGSAGYMVLYAHLSRAYVKIGDHVTRGQRIGLTGNTGNAAGTPPHLHFEVRAPFLIRVREAGTVRRIDAFDPYPSLAESDPRRH